MKLSFNTQYLKKPSFLCFALQYSFVLLPAEKMLRQIEPQPPDTLQVASHLFLFPIQFNSAHNIISGMGEIICRRFRQTFLRPNLFQ